MTAGRSAAAEAARSKAVAEEYRRQAAAYEQRSVNFSVAAATEEQIARMMAPLSLYGYQILPDRRWPGSRQAQVDFVVVGPSGVFIVDVKAWRDLKITANAVFRGQEDATEEISNIADLVWRTEENLAELGLAPNEVHGVVVFVGKEIAHHRFGNTTLVGESDLINFIATWGQRLTPNQAHSALKNILEFFPPMSVAEPYLEDALEKKGNAAAPSRIEVSTVLPPIPLPASSPKVDPAAFEADAEVMDEHLLRMIFSEPVETWMTFLHPDQVKLVRRSFSGPSRIRGEAGTGKTVIGLHRAAYLARNLDWDQAAGPTNLLFTTYVRTLPTVLSALFERLAPDVANRVEFRGVHQVARAILDATKRNVKIPDGRMLNRLWSTAWKATSAADVLHKTGLDRHYWQTEIDYVVKSRGITSFDEYAELPRTGRVHRLSLEQREAVWQLYLAYEEALRSADRLDYNDLINLALKTVKNHPEELKPQMYRSVIIDEAQDLTAGAIKLLHALVPEEPDAFTLIGDGQQAIYPGGFTLSELGISVSGRAVVLQTNYRNTAQVLRFAQSIIAGDQVLDLETGELSQANVISKSEVQNDVLPELGDQALREGPEPELHVFGSVAEMRGAAVQRVQRALEAPEMSAGDIAVLAVSLTAVAAMSKALKDAGIAVIDLKNYSGETEAKVKVGTVKRAKGLEFKQVVLVDVDQDWLPSSENGAPAESPDENITLLRREIYVAMTRARDELWVGVKANN